MESGVRKQSRWIELEFESLACESYSPLQGNNEVAMLVHGQVIGF
jgi:hypothetical protein